MQNLINILNKLNILYFSPKNNFKPSVIDIFCALIFFQNTF